MIGLKKQFSRFNNWVEIVFFVSNFLTAYGIESYSVFQVVSYIKIINMTRSADVMYLLDKRQRKKMVEKYLEGDGKLKNKGVKQAIKDI